MGNYAGLTLLGADRYDQIGRSVAAAGDVNGDGIDDFLVGAPYANAVSPYANSGAVYVVFGTADGPATLDVADLDGTNGYRITTNVTTDENGFQVSDARIGLIQSGVGDVNGDGFDDIAIATRTYIQFDYDPTTQTSQRRAVTDIYVIFGTNVVGPASIETGDAAGFEVLGVNGRVNGISAAGDINGDNLDDFLISQSPVIDGYYGGGYFGVSAAVGAGPGGTLDDAGSYGGFVLFGDGDIGSGGAFDVATLDGENGFGISVPPSNLGGYYGEGGYYGIGQIGTVALGDINGDGFDDLGVAVASRNRVVEVRYYNDQPYNYYTSTVEDRGFVLFGTDAGFDNVVDPLTDPRSVEVSWRGAFGAYNGYDGRVRGIGDVNGDGFDDVAVAIRNINRNFYDAATQTTRQGSGQVSIYFGGPDGVDFDGDRDSNNDGQFDGLPALGFPIGFDPDSFDPVPGAGPDLVIVDLDGQYGSFGADVVGVGDVDGDGIDDFVISEPYGFYIVEQGFSERGVFLVFGTPQAPGDAGFVDLSQSQTAYRIESSSSDGFSGFGGSISAAGDVNGDGFADFLLGDPSFDAPETVGRYEGAAFVVLGGRDALEAADNADGANDNVIDVLNLGADIGTGVVPIRVSIDDAGFFAASASEGDIGQTFLSFTVQRTGDLTQAVSVDFDVTGFGVNPADADDFGGVLPSGTVSFASGSAFATIEIAVSGDRQIEASEDFAVTLSNVVTTGAAPVSLGGDQAFGRIFNDDQPVFVQVFGLTRDENDPAGVGFRVQRFGDTSVAVTFDFEISAGAFSAPGADDVVGGLPRLGSVTLAAGQSFVDLLIDPVDDTIIESDELIQVQLTNIQAPDAEQLTVLNSTASAFIRNDDFGPRITVSGGGFVFEGNSSTQAVTFTVSRQGTAEGALDVFYSLNPLPNPGAFQAANDADVQGGLISNGVVSFAEGEFQKTVTVLINGDTTIEPNEFFELRVTGFDSEAGIPYELFQIARQATIGNDDGRPPVIPPGVEADVFGDPHIVTLDGLGYDFQAVGEYVLVETLPGDPDPFSVQVRFEPLPGSDLVSVTTRMAVEVGGATIEIDALGADPLLIDGVPPSAEDLALGAIDVDGDGTPDVFFDAGLGEFIIVLNDANEQLKVGRGDGLINVCVFLSDQAGGHAGAVRGLMGDADGNLSDDFQLRDGSALPDGVQTVVGGVPSLSFDFLYGRGAFEGAGYADSWRLASDERLFTNQVDFRDDFPVGVLTLDDLPADLVAAAREAAEAAGLTPGTPVFDAAVLDFALTGDGQFLDGALGLAADPQADSTPTGAPALPATVGVTPGEVSLVEGDSGTASALFSFYRIADTTGALTVTYEIGGDIDADDLAPGTALTGTVSFADGQSTASISVGVAGDLFSELDEDLVVRITGTSTNVLIAGATATTVIETDDFTPVAADDEFSIDEDAPLIANLFGDNENGEDADVDGDTLSVFNIFTAGGTFAPGDTITLASGAILRVNIDGTISFDAFGDPIDQADSIYDQLGAGEVATETFSYEVTDGNGGFDTATVTINVTGINDAPQAADLAITLDEDSALVANLLANAVDPEGEDLRVVAVNGVALAAADEDAAADGTQVTLASGVVATVFADGTLTYVPGQTLQFLGDRPGQTASVVDVLEFTLADEAGLASSGNIGLTVTGINDAPDVIEDLAVTFGEDDALPTLALLAPELVRDAEGDDLSLSNLTLQVLPGRTVDFGLDAASGELTLASGQFDDLAQGEQVVITLAYVITDGTLSTPSSATVTITGENDAPDIVSGASFSLAENTTAVGTVVAKDVDATDTLTFSIAGGADRALFEIDADSGALRFVAAPDFETPLDSAGIIGDNIYDVTVAVSDGIVTTTQDLFVTVTDVAEDVRLVIEGNNGSNRLRGTAADEIIRSKAGLIDIVTGGGGSDVFEFGDELRNGRRETETITDFRADDFLDLNGASIVREINLLGSTFLHLSGDGDIITLLGTRNFDEDTQLL